MELEKSDEFERSDETTPGENEDFSEQPSNELDLPPEYCHYQDEGCDLAESCLNCPLPKCIYDEAGGKQRWLKRRRAREMARLLTTKGKKIKEVALIFGVSPRTVQRALKQTLADSFTLTRHRTSPQVTPNRNESPNLALGLKARAEATGDSSQRGQKNG